MKVVLQISVTPFPGKIMGGARVCVFFFWLREHGEKIVAN